MLHGNSVPKPWLLNCETTLPCYRAQQGLQREAQLTRLTKIAGERFCLSFADFRTITWQAACQNVTSNDDTYTTAHSDQWELQCKPPWAAGRYTCTLPCASHCAPSPAHVPSAAEPGGQAVCGDRSGVRGQRTVQLLAHSHLAGLQHKLALQLLGQLLRQERALKLPGAGTVLWSVGHGVTNVAHCNSKGILVACSKRNRNNRCWIDWRLAKLHLPWRKSRFCLLAHSTFSII